MRSVLSVSSARIWTLAANLSTRGAGFVVTFLISRLLGTIALGEYSATINTASAVIQPFVQVVGNNSTLLSMEAKENGSAAVWNSVFANLLLVLAMSSISILTFLGLHWLTLQMGPSLMNLGTLAAAGTIIGQLSTGVLLGGLFGLDRFISSAAVSISVSSGMVLFAYPFVSMWGLSGAFSIVILGATFLTCGLALLICSGPTLIQYHEMRRAVDQFKLSLPSVARTALGASVSWLCTIYLANQNFGLQGVGVVAVATQWLTLMLLASSSWSGLTLKLLAEAARDPSPQRLRKACSLLLMENVGVTFVSSVCVFAAAGWIAKSYDLRDSGLEVLIRLNACCALVLAANLVFERLLYCLRQQGAWFRFSFMGFVVQIIVTYIFIDKGLFAIPLGSIVGSTLVTSLCLFGLNKRLLAGADVNTFLITEMNVARQKPCRSRSPGRRHEKGQRV